MRIVELRSHGGGFYRVHFRIDGDGGRWGDFDAWWLPKGATWATKYLNGNAKDEAEEERMEAAIVERFMTEVAI